MEVVGPPKMDITAFPCVGREAVARLGSDQSHQGLLRGRLPATARWGLLPDREGGSVLPWIGDLRVLGTDVRFRDVKHVSVINGTENNTEVSKLIPGMV